MVQPRVLPAHFDVGLGAGRLGGLQVAARRVLRAGRKRKYRPRSSGDDLNRSSPPASSIPEQLVPSKLISMQKVKQETESGGTPQDELTVYSLRFSTGMRRGSSMSDMLSGIWVCLIGQNGKSFLHRISPIFDPEREAQNIEAICRIADVGAGANCALALKSSGSESISSSTVSQRFIQGALDEVSFMGPELGPLAALIVGPESGSWNLDEVTVSSSRTEETVLFICREMLGGRSHDGAAFLTPVPPGTVLYGSGMSGVPMTQSQAEETRKANMEEYSNLKIKLLLTTMGLVVGGGAFAAVVGGSDVAIPFALGGSVGLLYQWLLQKGVDAVKVPPEMKKPSDDLSALADEVARSSQESTMEKIVGSQFFRLGVVFLAATVSFLVLQSIGSDSVLDNNEAMVQYTRMQHIVAAGLGFFTYKFAVIGVTMSSGIDKEDVMQEDRH